jgi:hypothetical protein
MGETTVYSPQYWLGRALKARLTADAAADVETKRLLMEVADSYERLATDAEKRQLAVLYADPKSDF